ncbi:SDR family oxidoreductase [Parafilimonas terrae]|uniref:3-oxoacyl-[acyl-carrier protein] reductase/L-fucose dehydrogenase n=1 Tax=Parafilimonas terrae TaxID=1465490 RepID=A0A1I5R153_9BACT|nr:SDR family oxidoreductase [Parafilimonas terrae]SFP52232.1 3-oxoacyl-[acyl-carrier protein] reductase/L-fucose dehydrogenase [Parafilimonas terrae]
MDLNLKDKTIIVSGTAGNLDEHLISMLAAEGAVPVAINASETGNLKITETAIPTGGKYLHVAATLSNPEACKAAIEKILKYTGGIFGLVNSVDDNNGITLETGSHEQFMTLLHSNFIPHYLLVQHALPALKISRGAIVNIISNDAKNKAGNNAHAAVNDGVKALTREWAVELLKYNIRVNAVLARNNQNEEIANTIAFLLSEKSSHTTGQIINCS